MHRIHCEPVTDAEILRAARELMVTRMGATTELLADRFGVDVPTMSHQLTKIESRGLLLSMPRWLDRPGVGDHFWVQPGEAAEFLTVDRYEEFEQRVRALATWKGYTLVANDDTAPPGHRRYTIGFGERFDPTLSVTGGLRIEKVLWKLRHLPAAYELSDEPMAAGDVG